MRDRAISGGYFLCFVVEGERTGVEPVFQR